LRSHARRCRHRGRRRRRCGAVGRRVTPIALQQRPRRRVRRLAAAGPGDGRAPDQAGQLVGAVAWVQVRVRPLGAHHHEFVCETQKVRRVLQSRGGRRRRRYAAVEHWVRRVLAVGPSLPREEL
jgi:hypothetical protein